jgi:hydroxymethylglutaryl-CoA lyase
MVIEWHIQITRVHAQFPQHHHSLFGSLIDNLLGIAFEEDIMTTQEISITEIGPRDGLQGEPLFMPTTMKSQLIHTLSQAGFSQIEVTAFAHPKWIPNLADAEEVIATTKDITARRYALIPNSRGFARAIESGIEGITTVFSATEAHNQKNLNRSIDESLQDILLIRKQASASNLYIRASISMVFGCPFGEGPSDARLLEIIGALYEGGYRRIGLCDTLGIGNPRQVKRITSLAIRNFPDVVFDLHFHDTYGRGLANVIAALESGITSFDSSIGGLGGCPYAPGATGNISTEDLVSMFSSMGLKTNINLDTLFKASEIVSSWRTQPLESQCWRVRQSLSSSNKEI